jgi:uncharacterized membrane protein YdbT with pleckstrin-like domain
MIDSIPQTPSEIKTDSAGEETHVMTVRRSQLLNMPWLLFAVYFCWLIIPVMVFLAKVLKIQCNRFTLTTGRFIEQDGVLNQREEQLELYSIMDITRTATWLQRILGCGDVRLQTSDPTDPDVVIRWIHNPEELTEKIRHHMNEAKKDLRHLQTPVG